MAESVKGTKKGVEMKIIFYRISHRLHLAVTPSSMCYAARVYGVTSAAASSANLHTPAKFGG